MRTLREYILVTEGPYAGWLMYKLKSGTWTTFRLATEEEKKQIREEAKYPIPMMFLWR